MLFSNNKLKLGTFGTNVSNGCAATTAEGHLEMNWPNTRDIVTAGDDAGFEIHVPVARWRGLGGKTNFNGASFEPLTWASGLGAITSHSTIFATTHMPVVHPIVAAKQCTTADHISDGRFGLNVVCGWFADEFKMFGSPMMEHQTRYDYAAEWIELVKRLWTEEEEFDFAGKFFTIEKGFHQPKPVRRPHPPVMNAGGSPTGARFAAKYADIAFISMHHEIVADNGPQIAEFRRMAREEFGREVQIWCNGSVVCRPTEKEARDYFHYYVHEKGDWQATDNLLNELGIHHWALAPEVFARSRTRFLAGWGGLPFVGTPEQIVDRLIGLSKIGLDGVALSWVNYPQELRQWARDVMPLIEQAGLRSPHKAKLGQPAA